ncbi:hypothetical protein B591_05149 [Streptomyces sp. GBA 94-10 4N24]|nr:hypothetical protein B591_05149 [Streptomyces sp. GBA 94-10 4N24]ESQ06547.1 hypothetical protein B590_05239 [Streptomyces sp. PVA_94-07]UZN58048.1 hypothetical protein B591N_05149 [Streptomyces sp. GBA 94-10 4N24]
MLSGLKGSRDQSGQRWVAELDADRLAAGLLAQAGHHGAGEVDAAHGDAARAERQSGPSGADGELQRLAAACPDARGPGGRGDSGAGDRPRTRDAGAAVGAG